MAKRHRVPVIVITGKIRKSIEGIYDLRVNVIYSIVNQPIDLKDAIKDAPFLIQQRVENIMRTINGLQVRI